MTDKLTFENVREWSSNGKKSVRAHIGLAFGDLRTRRDPRRATINIDLFPGNMNLAAEPAQQLREQYREYMRTAAPRKGRITNLHSHFNRTSIWFEVRPQDAGKWFDRVMEVLSDPGNVEREPEPFPGFYERFAKKWNLSDDE